MLDWPLLQGHLYHGSILIDSLVSVRLETLGSSNSR